MKTIKNPTWYMWAGVADIVMVCLIILLIFFMPSDSIKFAGESFSDGKEGIIERLAVSALFSPFLLLGLGLAVCASLWKVEVYDTYCIFRNSFGRKRRLEFESMQVQMNRARYDVYYKGKRAFYISYLIPNSESLQEAWEQYSKEKKHP